MRRLPRRFRGSLDQLQGLVALTRVSGDWEWMPAGFWRFRRDDGAILNWWTSTGTISFQGPPQAAADFEHCLRTAATKEFGKPELLPLPGTE